MNHFRDRNSINSTLFRRKGRERGKGEVVCRVPLRMDGVAPNSCQIL